MLGWQILGFFARNEQHVFPKYLEKSNGKPHLSHLVHPNFLCPPPYHNLFDTLTNNITSLFSVKLNPFHPFNFIIQKLHAFHGLLNGYVIQAYTTSNYLRVWTALCRNNYYCNNVAIIVTVFAFSVLQFLPCCFKILTNGLTLP